MSFVTIPLSRGLLAIVDGDDYERLSAFSWWCSRSGYAMRRERVDGRWVSVQMHRVVVNAPDGYVVDHINGNRLDNRKQNLRICTEGENRRNTAKIEGKSSRFKGVSWDDARQKWIAYITLNRKTTFLGRFTSDVDAAKAYNESAIEMFGEFARLNVLEELGGPKPNVFLFGRAASGKDEVRKYLQRQGYTAYSLAWSVKDMFQLWAGALPTGADRARVIDLGQSMKRIFGQEVWVDKTLERIARNGQDTTSPSGILICDGRYLVEYKSFVEEHQFIPVKIVASEESRLSRMLSRDGIDQREMIGSAENEVDQMRPEFTIVNDGTLDDLYAKVDEMMRVISK